MNERAFDRITHDLARVPAVHPSLIDTYLGSTRERLGDDEDRPLPEMTLPTEKELMALRCLAAGMTLEMAAETLGVGRETVRDRVKSARRKLAAKNLTHACVKAVRAGLIP